MIDLDDIERKRKAATPGPYYAVSPETAYKHFDHGFCDEPSGSDDAGTRQPSTPWAAPGVRARGVLLAPKVNSGRRLARSTTTVPTLARWRLSLSAAVSRPKTQNDPRSQRGGRRQRPSPNATRPESEAARRGRGLRVLKVRVPSEYVDRLDALCEETGFSRAEQIEALIDWETEELRGIAERKKKARPA